MDKASNTSTKQTTYSMRRACASQIKLACYVIELLLELVLNVWLHHTTCTSALCFTSLYSISRCGADLLPTYAAHAAAAEVRSSCSFFVCLRTVSSCAFYFVFLSTFRLSPFFFFFFFNNPPPPEFSPLPLHAALPI